jgi:hypothetical protein
MLTSGGFGSIYLPEPTDCVKGVFIEILQHERRYHELAETLACS